MEPFRSMICEDDGATMVEYALLIMLIAMVAYVSLLEIGHSVDRTFDSVRNELRGLGY